MESVLSGSSYVNKLVMQKRIAQNSAFGHRPTHAVLVGASSMMEGLKAHSCIWHH